MRPEGPQNGRYGREDLRRQRRRAGHRRLAIAAGFLALLVLAIGLGVGLTRGGSETSPTTSSSVTGSSTSPSSATAGAAVPTSIAGATEPEGSQSFDAQLDGEQEVPPVTTAATGSLSLTVAADVKSVAYDLQVTNIADLTRATLRVGALGQEGDMVAVLYDGPTKEGAFTGLVVESTLTESDLVGPLEGKAIDDLVDLLASSEVYVNVGTSSNLGGEIRGQIQETVAP